jgi:hypothetical protein
MLPSGNDRSFVNRFRNTSGTPVACLVRLINDTGVSGHLDDASVQPVEQHPPQMMPVCDPAEAPPQMRLSRRVAPQQTKQTRAAHTAVRRIRECARRRRAEQQSIAWSELHRHQGLLGTSISQAPFHTNYKGPCTLSLISHLPRSARWWPLNQPVCA